MFIYFICKTLQDQTTCSKKYDLPINDLQITNELLIDNLAFRLSYLLNLKLDEDNLSVNTNKLRNNLNAFY